MKEGTHCKRWPRLGLEEVSAAGATEGSLQIRVVYFLGPVVNKCKLNLIGSREASCKTLKRQLCIYCSPNRRPRHAAMTKRKENEWGGILTSFGGLV